MCLVTTTTRYNNLCEVCPFHTQTKINTSFEALPEKFVQDNVGKL